MNHRRREAKAARRRKRLATESRWHANRRQRRLEATLERGTALMLLSITPAPRAKPKPDALVLAPFPCTCDPPRAHGPHWRNVPDGPNRPSLLDKLWKAVTP